jgi:hypothetical protein
MLLVWGATVAQYHATNSFLLEMVSAQWVIETRAYFIAKLDRAFSNPASYAFAKSLLFGTKTVM